MVHRLEKEEEEEEKEDEEKDDNEHEFINVYLEELVPSGSNAPITCPKMVYVQIDGR